MGRNSYKGEEQKCPYLKRWVGAHCRACTEPYYPSLFEVQEYCASKNYVKCPLLFSVAKYNYELSI